MQFQSNLYHLQATCGITAVRAAESMALPPTASYTIAVLLLFFFFVEVVFLCC